LIGGDQVTASSLLGNKKGTFEQRASAIAELGN
jgi:hypothetical protein